MANDLSDLASAFVASRAFTLQQQGPHFGAGMHSTLGSHDSQQPFWH